MIDLDAIRAARQRIQPHIRQTPLVQAAPVRQAFPGAPDLYLKLENMQIIGSFKARGAVNKLLSLPAEQVARGIITASGGNHGLGVAYAGWLANAPARIYLPHSTPESKAQKLINWGAQVTYEGDVWDDANYAALAHAERDGLTYFHPFADPAVIVGQGTVGLEVLDALPQIESIVIAIGGGGLISGISSAIKALKPEVRIIGVEATGAPTLYESLKAGHLIELAEIRTVAGTLAPRRSEQINLDIIQRYVDEIILVSDDDMRAAARWLWFEMGIAAELSGAAALAAVLTGQVQSNGAMCVLVCGAGTDGLA
ncbi:MAG: threonine/serine dehydratase [Anaerolineae bacterium]|nr:threonine/serine dehydratase [Anaerolineae bacterium]